LFQEEEGGERKLGAAHGQVARAGLFGTLGIGQHQAENDALDRIEAILPLFQIVIVALEVLRRIHDLAIRSSVRGRIHGQDHRQRSDHVSFSLHSANKTAFDAK